jgi:energy-coupling factor transporter ATP-binding protein EcfA2
MISNKINPFPGLRSFDFKEHHLFFGRERNIQDLLRKLEQNHFVAIVGTSGTGKSSLIKAGLLPIMNSSKSIIDSPEWIIASMKPGNTPLKNLANSLMGKDVFGTDDTEADKNSFEELHDYLKQSSLGLVQGVRKQLTGNKRLLILVDQFEEIFRFSDDNSEKNNPESNAFIKLIIDSVRQRDMPIYVILTLRSDFLGDCVRFEGLPEAINDGHYLVPRLTKDQNKAAITGPIDYAEGKISPRLVQQVINDLGDNPDQLPVLQHALMRTWDLWVNTAELGEPMDIRHYEMIGGLEHALSNHADEAFHELKNERQQKLIENVFKCLTVKTGDSRGIRRPTQVRNLLDITGATFDELYECLMPFRKIGRTFIMPDESVLLTETTILDISHESLMRGWDRLRNWVIEESESTDIYERLCNGSILYNTKRAGFWRDPELQIGLDWKEKNNPNEAWSKQYNNHFNDAISFLEESKKERSNELNIKNKRRKVIRGVVTTFLLVVTILSAWALLQTKEAKKQTIIADTNRIEAEQKAQEAINQKQLAEKAKEMALDASRQAMDAKSYAELQSNIAGEQKKLAEVQKVKAEQEALRATQQQQEALRQKQLAEQKSKEALDQKQKAETSQSEATRLRMLSISQNIAFKSIQQKEDPQLAALLAKQAYQMAKDNEGNMNDQQLYNAVYTASQKIDPAFKPIVIREGEEIDALNFNGKNIGALLNSGLLKTYSTSNFAVANQFKLTSLLSTVNTSYFNESGNFTAIGMDNNVAAIFDLKNPNQPHNLIGHTGLIRAVAFTDDASTIATGGRDSSVIIWKNYSISKKIKMTARVKALSFNHDHSQLYIGTEDGVVSQYTIGGSDKEQFAGISNSRVQSIQCSSNGKLIVVGYSNGVVQLLNNAGKNTRTLNESGSVDFINIDESNDVLVIGTANKIVHIYRLSDLSQKPIELNCNSSIKAISIHKGEFIYVACADKTIKMYPIKTSWFEKIFATNIKRDFTKEEWNTYIGADVPINK